jgi:prepilin-type processing-associated H-X9-DG protein
MRCTNCGTEIDAGALCEECAGKGSSASGCACAGCKVFGPSLVLLILVFGPMMFPSCHHRERAVQSRSLNNIKQLALAAMAYSQDYQETFPGWVRNPDGEYAHNVWDEQINGQVKSKDVFKKGQTDIASPSQPAPRDRALTYGLNALLIAPVNDNYDADFAAVTRTHKPEPLSPSAISNPAGTILFAELETIGPIPNGLLFQIGVSPSTRTGKGDNASDSWKNALGGNAIGGPIDISPHAWVETGGAGLASNYTDPYNKAATSFGVARDLYGGGGVYAFCDGHVQFMKIRKTVGLGTVTKKGLTITVDNCWSKANENNLWLPR